VPLGLVVQGFANAHPWLSFVVASRHEGSLALTPGSVLLLVRDTCG
jgi:hypothetical protein